MGSILARFPTNHLSYNWITYVQAEVAFAADDSYLHKRSPAEMVERRLSLVCDRRAAMSRPALEAGLAKAQESGVPLLQAQFRRALALADRDVAQMTAAIEIWERVGAVPQLGRGHAERGLLSGNQAEVELGLAALKKLGDANYVDSFAAQL